MATCQGKIAAVQYFHKQQKRMGVANKSLLLVAELYTGSRAERTLTIGTQQVRRRPLHLDDGSYSTRDDWAKVGTRASVMIGSDDSC